MYAQGLLKVKIESATSTTVSAMNMVGAVEPCTRSCCWVQLRSLLARAVTELADDLTKNTFTWNWFTREPWVNFNIVVSAEKGSLQTSKKEYLWKVDETWCFFHRSTNLDLFHIVMCLVEFFIIGPRWEQIDLVALAARCCGLCTAINHHDPLRIP